MGVQSSAVNEMGLSHVSTTFLTGTLTSLVASLVSPGQDTPHGVRRFGVLGGLLVGALLSGLLIATAAAGAPALPLAALLTTLVLASLRLAQRRAAPGKPASPQDRVPLPPLKRGFRHTMMSGRDVTGGCQHVGVGGRG
jgi:uncharacterized membrane protein YoaK (UPF0700 family)